MACATRPAADRQVQPVPARVPVESLSAVPRAAPERSGLLQPGVSRIDPEPLRRYRPRASRPALRRRSDAVQGLPAARLVRRAQPRLLGVGADDVVDAGPAESHAAAAAGDQGLYAARRGESAV